MTERLQDSFFRAVFHSPVIGIAIVDLASLVIIDANDVMLKILGRARDQLLDIREIWQEITPPEYEEANRVAFLDAVERGYSDAVTKEYIRKDGSRIPVQTTFARVQDFPDRLVVFAADVSDDWKRRLEDAERETRLKIAVSAADQGVWDYNLETGEMIYSVRAKEIYGFPADQPVTFEQVRDATHPDDLPFTHAQHLRAIDPSVRDRSSYEYRIIRPDGSTCWALAHGEAVFTGTTGAERATRYIGTLQDITERKLAEKGQRLLVAELNHRVKNTLAIVQSFAHQSFTPSRSTEEGRRAFEARLTALAATHHILTDNAWDEMSLGKLIQSSLVAHDPDGTRISAIGPELRVGPKTAVAVAMTMHELATNAVKYGSLSERGGSVDLRWSYKPPRLLLHWKESGGPACQPPQRRGFGTKMLERALAAELSGSAKLDYPPDGFVFELEAAVLEPL